MLTAEYLDFLPEGMMDLYREFEDSIIADIARRINKTGRVTSSAAWQAQRINESGMIYKNVIKEISKLTGKSSKELRQLFKDAGVHSLAFDDRIYKAAGMPVIPLNLSPAMLDVLKVGLLKTEGLLKNLTRTTANTAQQSFIQGLDLAHMEVAHGTKSYDQAIKDAIKKMAAQGLTSIDYPSGRKDTLFVAVRRAVLTGVQQTAGQLQNLRADQMGVDLVQTSAHYGARPTHQVWQGHIFSRSGTHSKYPDFIISTEYGSVTGLLGANCRHSFYPFFEGISENVYNDHMREALNQRTVMLNGKKTDQYLASQIQRSYERKIRLFKRQAQALGAAGLDNRTELNQVADYQARLRAFTAETKLTRQYVREGGRVKRVVVAPAPDSVALRPDSVARPVSSFEGTPGTPGTRMSYESALPPGSNWNYVQSPFPGWTDVMIPKIKIPSVPETPPDFISTDGVKVRKNDHEIEKGQFPSERVTIEGNGDAILKGDFQKRGWGTYDTTDGFAKREVMTYDVDQALGLNIVPKTTSFIERDYYKSLQLWENDATVGTAVHSGSKLANKSEPGKMALLDMLLGNYDRHGGNWLHTKDGHIKAIDNGLTMVMRDNNIYSPWSKTYEQMGRKFTGWLSDDKMILPDSFKDKLAEVLESGELESILNEATTSDEQANADLVEAVMLRGKKIINRWAEFFVNALE